MSVPRTHARAELGAGTTVPDRGGHGRVADARGAHALGHDIHDGLTQSVTSAILELQVLRHRIETDPATAVDVSSRSRRRSATT